MHNCVYVPVQPSKKACREENINNPLSCWYVSSLLYMLFYMGEPAVSVIGLLLYKY